MSRKWPPVPSSQKVTLEDLFAQIQAGRAEGPEYHRQGRRAGLRRGGEGLPGEALQRRGPGPGHPLRRGRHQRVATLCWPPPPTPSSWASTSVPTPMPRTAPPAMNVDMRMYRVIYDCHQRDGGRHEGHAGSQVPGSGPGPGRGARVSTRSPASGTIAGCYVTEGKMQRDAQVRLVRDNIVIHEGVHRLPAALQGRA